LVWKLAGARGLLDIPNERSSHKNPTPRGGGLAIVLVATVAFCCLAVTQRLDVGSFAALMGGVAVAAIGLLDDRRPLSPGVRLAAHFSVALWALAWLGGLPALRLGNHLVSLGAAGGIVGALVIVWVLNLFNFMDGIDGIAASEAIFIACAGAALTAAAPAAEGVGAAAWIFGGACLGFLAWNWPPARIFLGDAGSGYLGYVVSALALALSRGNPAALWVWLILGGVFFVDATVTLLRRLLRGESAHQAHRTHAYQWLARRWQSHLKVTLAVQAVNLLWLLPWALLARRYPSAAAALVVLALAPLAALAIAAGAGRAETIQNSRL
jgi:Fuc2NAc and GlcNAc transferase